MKGFRTIAFNVIMTLIAVISLLNPAAELPDAEAVGSTVDLVDAAITAVWGIGNLILRAITNSPIFSATPSSNGSDES